MASTVPSFINMRSTGTSGHVTRYSDGRFLSVWTDFDKNGGAYVYGKLFNADGTAAGNHFLIDYAATATYREITAETLTDGRTVVAWVKSDSSGASVVGKILDQNFQISGALLTLGDPEMTMHESPQISATTDGSFSVIYTGKGLFDAESNIRAVRITDVYPEQGGTWSKAYNSLHTRVDDPAVATTVLRNQSLVIAQADNVDGDTVLEVSIVPFDGSITNVQIDTISGVASGINPAVSALDNGGFVLAWEDVDNNARVIRIQSFTSAGQPDALFSIAKPAGTIYGTPVIEPLANDGGFAIAFTMNVNGAQDLYTAAVNAQGITIVEPTTVGTSTLGDQWDPSITALSSGTYAVSWQSTGFVSGPQYVVEVIGREGTDVTTVITPGGTGGPGEPLPPPPPPPPPGSSTAWTGTEANDIHVGSAASETFNGLGGRDSIRAGGGNDTVDGGSGNDKIWGGAGNDVLMGRDGFDVFVFDTKPNKSTNKDAIVDFGNLFDSIWLENKVFTKLGKKGSEKKPAMIKKSMFALEKAKDKDDYIVYSKKKGTISYDADGSGSKYKAVEIATVKKGSTVTHSDFYVI